MKIIYHLGQQNIYYGLSSMVKSLKNLCRKFVIEENSESLIIIDNVDESFIDRLTRIVSDYYHITTMEIYTESDWQKLNSDDIANVLATKPGNDDITSVLEKFETTLYWARNKRNAPMKTLVNYIFSNMRTISMAYDEKRKPIQLSVGDVVEVNFGFNLPGEISGSRVNSIVSNIENDMIFVTPIIRLEYAKKLGPTCSIELNIPDDIEYFEAGSPNNGVALLRKSKLIRIERVNAKIGVASPNFMEHLLSELPKAFDFRNR